MKRIVLLTLLALGIGGCGEKQKSNEILIWTHSSPEHPEGKAFEERVLEYNKKNPDKIQVKIQNFTRTGAGSGYIDKLNAAITAGETPDIFTLDGPDLASYVDAGIVKELTPIVDKEFLSGITTSIIEQGSINDRLYSIGYQDSGVIITYNKEIFELLPDEVKELAPKSPSDTWTWDDFYLIATELKKLKTNPQTKNLEIIKNMEIPVSFGIEDVTKGAYEIAMYYLAPIIWSNDATIISKDGLQVKGYLDSEKSIEALMKLGRFFADDLGNIVEPEKAFHTGKAAMAIAGNWYISDFQKNYPNLNYGAFVYPKMSEEYTKNYTPSGSWTFVMNSQLEDGNEKTIQTTKVLEWLTNDDSVELYYKKNGAVPVRKEKLNIIDTNTPDLSYNEAWDVLKYEVEYLNKARPASPAYPYISETFAKDIILKIGREKLSSEKDIRECVNFAVEKMEKELSKYRK